MIDEEQLTVKVAHDYLKNNGYAFHDKGVIIGLAMIGYTYDNIIDILGRVDTTKRKLD